MSEMAFLDEVGSRIRLLLAVSGTIEFSTLVTSLRGTDPAVVRRVVMDSPDISSRVNWTPLAPIDHGWSSPLPVPHPLDYDWRFSQATLENLHTQLLSHGRVALLGAPSVWNSLRAAVPHRSPHLYDLNAALLNQDANSAMTVCDLVNDEAPMPLVGYDVVLADPPWYPDAVRGFIWNAVRLVRMDGSILLSMPPIGTRPGVLDERSEFESWISTLGLVHTDTAESSLFYEMPPFEQNALRALGLLQFVPRNWRAGDLFVLRRSGAPSAGRPTPIRADGVWEERVLAGVRFRVRVDIADVDGAAPALTSIVDGDILGSVSRRDPRRDAARVWTSGNRAFGCSAPRAFLEVLDQLVREAPPANSEISSQVQQLVARERSEYLCE